MLVRLSGFASDGRVIFKVGKDLHVYTNHQAIRFVKLMKPGEILPYDAAMVGYAFAETIQKQKIDRLVG